MTARDRTTTASGGRQVSRRTLLAAAGTAAGTALAGCSEVSPDLSKDYSDRTFEAAPVVLPERDREDLGIAETARDARTVSRGGPSDDTVEMTDRIAVYSRAVGLGGR